MKLWGGRFEAGPSEVFERFSGSLDFDRRLIDAEHTRGFARRGADAARELGEVVGGMQPPNGTLPAVAVDQVVPVGNDVAERAPLMTERYAAIHAA